MIFWWSTVAILCLAAFGDGYTTQVGVKSGKLVEGNKLLDDITGTDTPNAFQTYGVGFLIITAEVLFGTLAIHNNLWGMKWIWPYAALIQAGFHVFCIFDNYKLDTGKSLL
jgi:hypothetical protein